MFADGIGAWCYTVNGPRWEYCDVPHCQHEQHPNPDPRDREDADESALNRLRLAEFHLNVPLGNINGI